MLIGTFCNNCVPFNRNVIWYHLLSVAFHLLLKLYLYDDLKKCRNTELGDWTDNLWIRIGVRQLLWIRSCNRTCVSGYYGCLCLSRTLCEARYLYMTSRLNQNINRAIEAVQFWQFSLPWLQILEEKINLIIKIKTLLVFFPTCRFLSI